jgi:hypothetical protein
MKHNIHNLLMGFDLAMFLLTLLVIGVGLYLLCGLFGPRQVDPIPEYIEEPSEEEFNSPG